MTCHLRNNSKTSKKWQVAIENLLYMEAIKFGDADHLSEKAILSNQFSIIISNVMTNMNLKDDDNEIMKLMYYSLLIYINEYLKLPKSLTMALGNDLERREEMESGELISNYVTVLHSIFTKAAKRYKKI